MELTSWTDALIPELAEPLRGGNWARVDRLRDGRFAALQSGAGARWFAVEDGELRCLSLREDKKLPALGECVDQALQSGYSVKLLAHRFHSRAVLDLCRDQDARILKIYRKPKHVALRWQALRPSADGRWRSPEVLRFDEARGVLEIERAPGSAPYTRARSGDLREEHLRAVVDVLDWLAEQPLVPELPRHGVDEECRVLEERRAEFEAVLAQPPSRVREIVEASRSALSADPVHAIGVVHRDFHDKQLLLDDRSRGVLVDLDLVALGPPALDVGNFLGHLYLRHLQGVAVGWPDCAAGLVDFADRRGLKDSLWRWTAATLARLALIYSRRVHTRSLLDSLLVAVEEVLAREGEWERVL